MDSTSESIRRGQYRTTSGAQLDDRRLHLRGGALNGQKWEGVVRVGERVFCGTGTWSPAEIYLVTGEIVVDADGNETNIAVPAFAAR